MNRREISRVYKERKLRGGVYTITNSLTGQYLIGHAADLASVRSHFQFAVTTGSAIHPKLRHDWGELGGKAFALDVLEELDQGPEQSQAEFMADLQALEHMCRATLDPDKEY